MDRCDRLVRGFLFGLLWLVPSGCAQTEWVHPTKPKSGFAQEYSRCETRAMQDPQMQAGMRMMLQDAIERCLRGQGWMLVEKP